MALVTLSRPILYPGMWTNSGLLTISNGATLDAAGEYLAIVFQAHQAMTISHVGFRTATVAGSPTADVRVETVGADGTPSGTLWATDTNIVTATLVSNTFALHALTASASVTKGEFVAIKVAYESGTSAQIAQLGNGWPAWSTASYRVVNTGTPTKAYLNALTTYAVGSSTSSFYSIGHAMPLTAETDTNFNSGSGTIRYGVRFQVPFKCRFRGLSFVNGTSGDFEVNLYSDAGAELASTAVDGDFGAFGAPFLVDDDVELAANTWYRAVIEATTVTDVEVQTVTLPSADYISATPWGANAHLTTWNGSAWDDTNTDILPLMNLALDQIDDGAGGGASVSKDYGIQPTDSGVF